MQLIEALVIYDITCYDVKLYILIQPIHFLMDWMNKTNPTHLSHLFGLCTFGFKIQCLLYPNFSLRFVANFKISLSYEQQISAIKTSFDCKEWKGKITQLPWWYIKWTQEKHLFWKIIITYVIICLIIMTITSLLLWINGKCILQFWFEVVFNFRWM